MSARKHTELTPRDKVRLIKASSGKSHRQLAVETDDNDTSDSMSVIKKNTNFMRLWQRLLSPKNLQQIVT